MNESNSVSYSSANVYLPCKSNGEKKTLETVTNTKSTNHLTETFTEQKKKHSQFRMRTVVNSYRNNFQQDPFNRMFSG